MTALMRYWLLLVALMSAPTHSLAVEGRWNGAYVCPQGVTGVTLIIRRGADGKTLSANFCFCAIAANPALPTGEFELDGWTVPGSNVVELTPRRWIQQPKGWSMIPLTITPSSDGRSLTGSIASPGCGALNAVRAPENDGPPRCQCSNVPIS
jgi:hypothetical protein